ncbi:MAG: helix-turn-helix transcriptional regulator [Acidobacteriaceae bacterium]|nr:helix-turn-helix transcriptional regulator [Acidobacteriaceae bacterium]
MEQATIYPRISTTTLAQSFRAEDLKKSHRLELASFLKAKRDSLMPTEIGLPNTARRRVKGLRREEVAEAASISVAWYTWIEQARELQISELTLDRLSSALHLNGDERAHLFQLAGYTAPLPVATQSEKVLSSVQGMIDSMDPNPTYAMNATWDVVAWNQAAAKVIFDFAKLPADERNFVRLVFTSSAIRKKYLNWEELAHCTIAHFRTDSVGHVADPHYLRLIDDMNAQSPEFQQLWPRHNVAWPPSWHKEMQHPKLGRLAYNSLDLELHRPAKLRIITYIPKNE